MRFHSVNINALNFSAKYKDDKKKWDKCEGMEVDVESGASVAESSLSPSANEDDSPKVDPLKWSVSVSNIIDFIFIAL